MPGLDGWILHASDLSLTVLESAASGLFRSSARSASRPRCSSAGPAGRGDQEGLFGFVRELRERVSFYQVNLVEPLPNWEPFDVIFLRNVLIYFEPEVKRTIAAA